jgi:hypothetical protein
MWLSALSPISGTSPPHPFHPKPLHPRIRRNNRQSFHQRLRGDHAVERIAVLEEESSGAGGMGG